MKCVRCGKEIKSLYKLRKYCYDCKKDLRRERIHRLYLKKKGKIK